MLRARSIDADTDELPSLGPVLDFMRRVWAFDHALQRRSEYMKRTLGITAPQRLAVRVLGRFPGMQAGQLARVLHLHPGTLSGILKRLERKGVVRRRADPRDRRRITLGLTAAGRGLNVEADGTVESVIGRCLATEPRETVEAALEVLGKLTQVLDIASSTSANSHRPADRIGTRARESGGRERRRRALRERTQRLPWGHG